MPKMADASFARSQSPSPSPSQWEFRPDELDGISLTSTAEDENEYFVESIVAERHDPDFGTEFLVRWMGFADDIDCTWAPQADFEHAGGSAIVAAFRFSPRKFDLESYETRLLEREIETSLRKRKRAEKRARAAYCRKDATPAAKTPERQMAIDNPNPRPFSAHGQASKDIHPSPADSLQSVGSETKPYERRQWPAPQADARSSRLTDSSEKAVVIPSGSRTPIKPPAEAPSRSRANTSDTIDKRIDRLSLDVGQGMEPYLQGNGTVKQFHPKMANPSSSRDSPGVNDKIYPLQSFDTLPISNSQKKTTTPNDEKSPAESSGVKSVPRPNPLEGVLVKRPRPDPSKIFSNWMDPVKSQKGKSAKVDAAPKAFTTLQQRNWARKSARKETSIPIGPAQLSPLPKVASQTKPPAQKSPMDRHQPQNPEGRPLSIQETKRNGFHEEEKGIHGLPKIWKDQTSISRVDPHLVTCWYWQRNDACHEPCPLEHMETTQIAAQDNILSKGQASCSSHFQSECKKSAKDCQFSHSARPYFGPEVLGASITRNPLYRGTVLDPALQSSSLDKNPKCPEHGELMGCYHHHIRGRCWNSDGECHWSHENTRFVEHIIRGEPPIFRALGEKLFQSPHPGWKVRFVGARIAEEQQRSHAMKAIPTGPQKTLRDLSSPHRSYSGALSRDHDFQAHQTASTLKNRPATSNILMPNTNVVSAILCIVDRDGQYEQNLECQILFDNDREKLSYLNAVEASSDSPKVWECSLICKDDDAKHFFDCVGSLQKTTGQLFTKNSALAETLKAYAAAAVCSSNEMTMFVYPSKSNFQSLFGTSESREPTSELRFCLMFETLSRIAGPLHVNYEEGTEIREAGSAPAQESLCAVIPFMEDKKASMNIMMVYERRFGPRYRQLVADLQSQGAKVYDNNNPGSWMAFCQNHTYDKQGMLIFQHEFNAWNRVKILSRMLRGPMTVLSLGPRKDMSQEASVIFPSGLAVLITDDCISDFPDELLPAIELLRSRKETRRSGTHVCGRPNLLKWLKEIKKPTMDQQSIELLEKIERSLRQIEQISASKAWPRAGDELGEPNATSGIISPREMVSYEKKYKLDSVPATCMLLDWFSKWAREHSGSVRRFVVLSTANFACRQQWTEQYPLLFIMTPAAFTSHEQTRMKQTKAERAPAT